MFHAQTWRACSCVALLCPPRGPQLFHSHVNFTCKIVLAKYDFCLSLRSHFTSQERAYMCTFDFLSEVSHFTSQERACKCEFWLSLRSHFTSQEYACKCTFDLHSEVTSNLPNIDWTLERPIPAPGNKLIQLLAENNLRQHNNLRFTNCKPENNRQNWRPSGNHIFN